MELSTRLIFLGTSIYFRDNTNRLVLIGLGGSTSMGFPYEQNMSAVQLVADTLNEYRKDANKKLPLVTVENFSQLGANISYNYWELYRYLHLRRPKKAVIFLYSGINDYFSEKHSPWKFEGWRVCQLSLLCRKISFHLVGSGYIDWSPKHYAYMLRQLISLAKDFDVPVILSTLVGNYEEYDPTFFYQGEQERVLNEILTERDSENIPRAIKLVKIELEKKRNINVAFYYFLLSRLQKQLGDYEAASASLLRSRNYKKGILPTGWQNNVIRKIAKDMDVKLNDTEKEFLSSNYGFDANGFIDEHHPYEAGYLLLARGFLHRTIEILGIDHELKLVSPVTDNEHNRALIRSIIRLIVNGWNSRYLKDRIASIERRFLLLRNPVQDKPYLLFIKAMFGIFAEKENLFIEAIRNFNVLKRAHSADVFKPKEVLEHLQNFPRYRNIVLQWTQKIPNKEEIRAFFLSKNIASDDLSVARETDGI